MAPNGNAVTSYRDLQRRAKQLGLRANGSRAVLVQLLAEAEQASGSSASIGATRENGGITLWPNGFAGIHKDGLFSVLPGWVDASKRPGGSSIENELSLSNTLKGISRLAHFFMSPNFVWFVMAAAMHYWVPYEMAKDAVSNAAWLKHRFALNFTVAFAYYGFFFAALYIFKLAKRKYRPNSYPTVGNMAHNMWYWTLGIVQWTFWEAVMVQLWANGTVSHKTNAEVLADRNMVIINALAIFLVPGERALCRGVPSSARFTSPLTLWWTPSLTLGCTSLLASTLQLPSMARRALLHCAPLPSHSRGVHVRPQAAPSERGPGAFQRYHDAPH